MCRLGGAMPLRSGFRGDGDPFFVEHGDQFQAAAHTSRANQSAPRRFGNSPQPAPSINQAHLWAMCDTRAPYRATYCLPTRLTTTAGPSTAAVPSTGRCTGHGSSTVVTAA